MATPTIFPAGFAGTTADFTKTAVDRSGAVRMKQGTVSVPNGTAANTIIGLVPFNKGARFQINDKSIYCGNFGAGTTTVNIGVAYNSASFTDDLDAFASAATAPQSGGFVTVDEFAGLTFVAEGDGWLIAQVLTAAADATESITFNVGVGYDG